MRLYPEYILSYALLILTIAMKHESISIRDVVMEISLLKSMGLFPGEYNYPVWYVCVLIWGELILYLAMVNNKQRTINLMILIVVLFGYPILLNSGKANGTLEKWDSFYPLLRALCGLSLGMAVFKLQEAGLITKMKIW